MTQASRGLGEAGRARWQVGHSLALPCCTPGLRVHHCKAGSLPLAAKNVMRLTSSSPKVAEGISGAARTRTCTLTGPSLGPTPLPQVGVWGHTPGPRLDTVVLDSPLAQFRDPALPDLAIPRGPGRCPSNSTKGPHSRPRGLVQGLTGPERLPCLLPGPQGSRPPYSTTPDPFATTPSHSPGVPVTASTPPKLFLL